MFKTVNINEDLLYELTGVSLYESNKTADKYAHLLNLDRLKEIVLNPEDSIELDNSMTEIEEFKTYNSFKKEVKRFMLETLGDNPYTDVVELYFILEEDNYYLKTFKINKPGMIELQE